MSFACHTTPCVKILSANCRLLSSPNICHETNIIVQYWNTFCVEVPKTDMPNSPKSMRKAMAWTEFSHITFMECIWCDCVQSAAFPNECVWHSVFLLGQASVMAASSLSWYFRKVSWCLHHSMARWALSSQGRMDSEGWIIEGPTSSWVLFSSDWIEWWVSWKWIGFWKLVCVGVLSCCVMVDVSL